MSQLQIATWDTATYRQLQDLLAIHDSLTVDKGKNEEIIGRQEKKHS